MLYRVTGADAETARDRVVFVRAQSEEAAIGRARAAGVLADTAEVSKRDPGREAAVVVWAFLRLIVLTLALLAIAGGWSDRYTTAESRLDMAVGLLTVIAVLMIARSIRSAVRDFQEATRE